MKKNRHSLVVAGLSLLLVTGCNVAEKLRKQQNKTDSIQGQIDRSERDIEDKGRAYNYGTGVALAKATNQEPAVEVAKDLNRTSQLLIGPPKVDDAVTMNKIVDGRLSTDEKVQHKAIKLESEFLAEVALKEKEIAELKLAHKDELAKEREQGAVNAGKAQQWDELQRKNIFKRIFFHLGIWGTLAAVIAVMVMFPVTIPFVARFVGWLVGRMPKLAAAVGTVGVQTVDRVAKGIAEIRREAKENPNKTMTYAEFREQLDISLKMSTDESDRRILDQRREALQLDVKRV